jgi:hypothetical protein
MERAAAQPAGMPDRLRAPTPDTRLLAIALVASAVGLGGCAHHEPAATAAARRSAQPARHTAPSAPARTEQDAPAPLVAGATGIAAARRFARARSGTVAFAVLDGRGRLRGLRRTVQFPSASVSKAMLMVAVLRRARDRPLSAHERALLRPMVTASDNDAADLVYAAVGGAGLSAVAAAAGSRRFADVGHWAATLITAADQARLFMRIDALVPARHRVYARTLLSSIVRAQRWGIAPVARRRAMRILFKGGWREDIVHQVALVERRGRRVALAILCSGQPSQAYGQATLRGIAARVLH